MSLCSSNGTSAEACRTADVQLIMICSFDSRDDGKTAILTPHTAFDDASKPEGALPRESIELRLLVFYDD